MKHEYVMVAVGAVSTLLAMGTALADPTADLIKLDRDWGAAGVKGDAAAVGKLLADNLVSVDNEGVRNKQAELAMVKARSAAIYRRPSAWSGSNRWLKADRAPS